MSALYPRVLPLWARPVCLFIVAGFGIYAAWTITELFMAVSSGSGIVIVEPHLFFPLLIGVPLGLVTLAAHSMGDRTVRCLIGIGGLVVIAAVGIPIELSLERSTSDYLLRSEYARCAPLDQVRHERNRTAIAQAWARQGYCSH